LGDSWCFVLFAYRQIFLPYIKTKYFDRCAASFLEQSSTYHPSSKTRSRRFRAEQHRVAFVIENGVQKKLSLLKYLEFWVVKVFLKLGLPIIRMLRLAAKL